MFAKDVLRTVRLSTDRPTPNFIQILRNLLFSRIGIAACACGMLAFAIIGVHSLSVRVHEVVDSSASPNASYAVSDPASEMVAVAYLGQLMTVSDPGQLDEESLSDLFF